MLGEMTKRIDVQKYHYQDDDYEPLHHHEGSVDQYGDEMTHVGADKKGNRFYQTRFADVTHKDNHDGFVVTRKDGQSQFNISGEGNNKTGKFVVRHASSNENRSLYYHQAIHHLVNSGHVKEWHGDTQHSPGSEATYRRLAAHPDLTVHHRSTHTGTEQRVTPENIDKMYTIGGRFVVRKKDKEQ